MAKKYVYFFGAGSAEGKQRDEKPARREGRQPGRDGRDRFAGPPGFTVSTEVCELYIRNKKKIPEAVKQEVEKNLKKLEKAVGQGLGDVKNPLLVFHPLRRPGLYARHDGYHPQPGTQ